MRPPRSASDVASWSQSYSTRTAQRPPEGDDWQDFEGLSPCEPQERVGDGQLLEDPPWSRAEASGAPRQWWGPDPNDRCSLALSRRMSKGSGSGKCCGSWLDTLMRPTRWRRRYVGARQLHGTGRAASPVDDRRVVAQDLLDRAAQSYRPDRKMVRKGDVADGVMQFTRSPAPDGAATPPPTATANAG